MNGLRLVTYLVARPARHRNSIVVLPARDLPRQSQFVRPARESKGVLIRSCVIRFAQPELWTMRWAPVRKPAEVRLKVWASLKQHVVTHLSLLISFWCACFPPSRLGGPVRVESAG